MDFIDALHWRYAVRQFSSKRLNEQQHNGLIESVRLSASAYGLQPYRLFVIENTDIKSNLLPFCYGQHKIVNNSHLFILAHDTCVTNEGVSTFIDALANNQHKTQAELGGYKQVLCNDLLIKTRREQRNWAAQQCYIALGKLLSYAAINKIDACPMTGFDNVGVNRVLGLNELSLNAGIMCPVGFRSSHDINAFRPKYRKSISDLVTLL